LKKIFIIIVLLLGIGFSETAYAQTGGRKHEKYKRKGARRGNFHLTQYKSRGHADDFARGRGRKGLFARLFKKDRPAWVYRSSGSRKSHFRDNQYLFTRERSKGKIENDQINTRQNAERSKNRVKGNRAFRFRKYKR
jgi:hypothetical protein